MTVQYLRNVSLIVATAAGSGIELGALRIVFNIRRGDTQTPNTTDIRVYNLNDNTARQVKSPEFTQLQLKVSYGTDALQLVFRGSIKQVRLGREDQRNSYVDITAADGDEAYNFAPIALTLAAGATAPKDSIQAMIAGMAKAAQGSPTGAPGGQVIGEGYLPEFGTNNLPRGKVHFGMCRDELRQIARANNCTWNVQDGNVTFIPVNGYIPGEAVLITPATGLIGTPEQTQNGLSITVLLNPNIKIGQLIQLDSKAINQLRFGTDINAIKNNLFLKETAAKLNADGLYYVMRADHTGDSRGTTWYTNLTCLAVDASAKNVELASGILGAGAIPQY